MDETENPDKARSSTSPDSANGDNAAATDDSADDYYQPSSVSLPSRLIPERTHIRILDQGSEGAVVGFALAAMINYMRSERGVKEPVSPRMLYEMAKRYDEWPGEDYEGSSVRGAMIGWREEGVCPDALWPYRSGEPGELSEDAARVARENKPQSIHRIDIKVDDLKAAVHETHAIAVGATITNAWWNPDHNGRIPSRGKDDEPIGGHAFAVLGYTEDAFIIQNSWGQQWSTLTNGNERFPGLALWSYEDFEADCYDAWMARLPSEPQSDFDTDQSRSRAGFRSDGLDEQQDCFSISHDVESLCMVVASRDVEPPLSIGLFGDWGVGKSFFIREMKATIQRFCDDARLREKRLGDDATSTEPAFWSEIVQIEFNAWHFMDANLWASLVVCIFDELATHVAAASSKPVNDERLKLLEKIEKQHVELAQLDDEKRTVEEELKNARKEILNHDESIANKRETLSALDFARIAARSWEEQVKASPALEESLEDLGVPTMVQSVTELNDSVAELRSVTGKAKIRAAALFNDGNPVWRAALVLLILIAGFGISWAVSEGLAGYRWSDLAAELSKIIACAAGIVAAVARWLVKVNRQIRDILKAYDTAQKTALQSPDKDGAKRKSIETEIKALKEKRDETQAAINARERRLEYLQRQIEDLRVGRRLFRFIEEKIESPAYREKLGIVASIRADLEVLTELLAENSRGKRDAWRGGGVDGAKKSVNGEGGTSQIADIDRIVLYIDDLDRCPPERVVEVLQAVHLLLAFNLFVVVVAVDSRWLLRSLEKHYPEFLALDDKDSGEITRRASTPQNYLEKIFQIAYEIRPMTDSGYRALLDDLVSAVDQRGTPAIQLPPPTTAPAAAGTAGASVQPTAEGRKIAERPAHLAAGDSDKTPPQDFDPNPPNLEIGAGELEVMKDLYGLIGTARGVKRFVNTYRLFRASLWSDELRNYIAAGSDDPPAVMTLMAVLIGSPEEANWIFRGLDSTTDDASWPAFIEGLKPIAIITSEISGLGIKGHAGSDPDDRKITATQPEETWKDGEREIRDVLRYENAVCKFIGSNREPRWRRLQQNLEDCCMRRFATIRPLRKWVRPVARYAFYPLRFDTRASARRASHIG